MNLYSAKVLDHFRKPRNVGAMDDASGVGEMGDPSRGDFLRVYIKVEDDIVRDVKYEIRGCPAAIACASAMTELSIGRNLDDAMMIAENDIVQALDGLPEFKVHCSALGAAGLRTAIMDYFQRYVGRGDDQNVSG
jgi:nitrogen fixation protein NifU and related proteins